ncbi:MAG: patatin-like phospholipase family protein [Hyphomicrobiaceae bacterium]
MPNIPILFVLVAFMADVLGRFARHIFLFLVLYGGACFAIAGGFGTSYGVPYLFREDSPIAGVDPGSLIASPAFFTQFFATLFAGAIWFFAAALDPKEAQRLDHQGYMKELGYFGIRVIPTALLPMIAMAYPLVPSIEPLSRGEFDRAVIGMMLGLISCALIMSLTRTIEDIPKSLLYAVVPERKPGRRRRVRRPGPGVTLVELEDEGDGLPTRAEHEAGPSPGAEPIRHGRMRRIVESGWLEWLFRRGSVRRYVLWGLFTVYIWVLTQLPSLMPALAIFGLLGIVLSIYVALNFFGENWRAIVIAVLVAFLAFQGMNDFRYRYPGMDTYYTGPLVHFESDSVLKPRAERVARRPDRINWRELAIASRMAREQVDVRRSFSVSGVSAKPKFVVVTTSGGAYRAAFWTALVLDLLKEQSLPGGELEGLAPSIRLMTGASGGMVGAAYFAVMPKFYPDPDELARKSVVDVMTDDIDGLSRGLRTGDVTLRSRGRRDSLTPVLQQLMQSDIFHLLSRRYAPRDRGKALEEQWLRLEQTTFKELRDLEQRGLSPALVFSPMIVETGQPLLISNLDLSEIARSSKGETLSFFDVFPKAYDTFKVSTAARMSANFPYASPTVNLPIEPTRRVVDAGYFDNFGMNIALSYLRQGAVRQWLKANTAGVIIVQINAYPLDPGKPAAVSEGCEEETAPAERSSLARAFAWLTSPLEGLAAARQASMVYRNEQELEALKLIYSGESIPLDRVTFENAGRASFSWYLRDREFDCMRRQLSWSAPGSSVPGDWERNKKEYERLVSLWKR